MEKLLNSETDKSAIPVYICMAPGAGKTFLSLKYPDLFQDIDTLCRAQFQSSDRPTSPEGWSIWNSMVKLTVEKEWNTRLVLLCHSPEQSPFGVNLGSYASIFPPAEKLREEGWRQALNAGYVIMPREQMEARALKLARVIRHEVRHDDKQLHKLMRQVCIDCIKRRFRCGHRCRSCDMAGWGWDVLDYHSKCNCIFSHDFMTCDCAY